MKQIGYKVNIGRKDNECEFVILNEDGTIKKSPRDIKTHEFSQSFGMYIYELLLDNGNKEFFLEDKGLIDGISQGDKEGTVFTLDRMNNAKEIRMNSTDVFYKKGNIWYVYHVEEEEKNCIIKEPLKA